MEDKIISIKKRIRLCSILSICAVAVTLLLVAGEYVAAEFYKDAAWAEGVIKGCVCALYVMPYAIVVPLFVRVNLKGKLYQAKKQINEM